MSILIDLQVISGSGINEFCLYNLFYDVDLAWSTLYWLKTMYITSDTTSDERSPCLFSVFIKRSSTLFPRNNFIFIKYRVTGNTAFVLL